MFPKQKQKQPTKPNQTKQQQIISPTNIVKRRNFCQFSKVIMIAENQQYFVFLAVHNVQVFLKRKQCERPYFFDNNCNRPNRL